VSSNHTVYYELRDAMAGEGCAICALALRGLRRYIEGLAYEAVNNVGIRAELRAARGFCAAHGQMLREVRSALGTAIIHRDIVGAAMAALEQAGDGAGGGLLGRLLGGQPRGGAAGLAPQAGCPACARRREAEGIYLGTLAARIADAELRQAFDASAGLCLPHARAALARCSPQAFVGLKEAQLAVWGRLAHELDEFIRKNDHQFAHEPVGAEGTSWSRASLLVSGHPLLGRAHDAVS
jgi:hypothetical protein